MKKLLPFAALLLFAALAFAQVNVTSVSGTVTDQTGAAIPGVSVQVVNPATGEKVNVVTSDRGQYAVPALAAATYKVTFSKAGFKTQTVENVALLVGVPGTLNAKMEVGAAAESVEVTAGAEVVQATTADVSSNLTGKQITDLPFATRNAIELTVDLPGTATPTNPRSSSINGLPKGALNVTLDGMNTQDNMLKTSDGFFSYIMPSVDAMEEVTVETSAAGVDSSAQGGAQIKFVTRSGTNTWHGGGFWQGRNTWFNANYYFNNQVGLPRDTIHLNQEGGHLGGPILKNKLFFFGNAEFYRYPGTNSYSRNYLTPSAASGVYTYVNSAGVQQQVNLLSLAAQANKTLPAGSIPYPTTADPILAKTYALMNSAGALGQVKNNQSSGDYNTLTTSYLPNGIDARDFFTTRIDYLLNSRNTLSIIYNYDWYSSIPDLLNGVVPDFPGTGTVLFSNVSTGQASNRFDGTISLRSTITPRMTNEYRMGLTGGTVLFFPAVSPGMFDVWRGYVPSFASAGTTLSGVSTTSGPQRRNAPVKNIADTVTWVKGSHQISFGGNFDQINLFQQIEGSALFPRISFGIAANDPIFTGATSIFTSANLPGANSSQLSNAANLYADVVGRVSGITQSLALNEQSHTYTAGAPIDRDQMREYGVFVTDQWRVSPSFTLNLGLRVEKQGQFQNIDNLYSTVSYQNIWGISGVGNLFCSGCNSGTTPVYNAINNNAYNPNPVFAPSIGLAWQTPGMEGFLGTLFGHTAGKTVLRGGYNIATVREGMGVIYALYGQNQGLTVDASVNPGSYPQYFGQPGSVEFSQATLPTRPVSTTPTYPIPACSGCSMYAISPNLKMGYVQSWNLSLQRELDRNTVIDFRYVGNHGTDLWRQYNLNETNIFGSSPTGTFFSQFLAAQNNLAIARGGNINANTGVVNWGNQGLPGQVNVPMLSTAVGTTSDSTTALNLQLGQAGTFANSIAGNQTRLNNLINAGYPANLFQVNPLGGGAAQVLTNDGASYFDAFQIEIRRRLAAGLLFNGSYQYAKSLADGNTGGSSYDTSQPTTLRNQRFDRAPSGFDIRNDIKMNWLYELPFGPGRAFGSNANSVVKKLIEGWELSGVVRLQSGTPLFLGGFGTMNSNSNGVVLHNITADQLRNMVGIYKTSYPSANGGIIFYLPPPQSPNGQYNSSYFNTLNSTNNTNLITNTMAAFNAGGLTPAQIDPSAPYIGPAAPGTMGWNGYVYLPWQHHFDLSLQKNTRFGEHLQLQFAVHALDVLNVTNFLPGSGNTSSTFGYVTSAYRDISGSVDPGARIIEWVLRLNF